MSFSGICIGGPKDGEYLEFPSTKFETYSVTTVKFQQVGDAEPRDIPSRERVTYQHTTITVDGAVLKFWSPVNVSLQDTFDNLTETYGNYADLKN